ncbi:MAG: PEP-CTERM sorting domain-containing protein, partial [Pirellulales bacterium]
TRRVCRPGTHFIAIVFAALAGTALDSASALDLFTADFEGLALKPVVTLDTEVRSRAAWTDIPPAGWTVDNSGVSTANDPDSGVLEFEGWRFVDKDWWVTTSGDQARSRFANGRGIVAVADPDEWDDFPAVAGVPSPDDVGPFDAKMKTPAISLTGVGANEAKLFLHSSWRDEDTQKASLQAIYNNGTTIDVFQWDSRPTISNGMGGTMPNPNFKDDAVNESLTLNLMNPAGATSVQLEFRVFDATNDWWWAIDNLQVFTGAAPAADAVLRATVDRNTGAVKIVNNTGETVNLRGYSVTSSAGTFNEAGATFLSSTDPSWLKATRLGDPSNDLSEIHLNDPAPFANQAEINFGNAWLKFYRDAGADIEAAPDIHFEYLTGESDEPVQGIVEFTGNGGNSFEFLDLNYSGAIEIGDWLAFKAGFPVSLTGLPEAQRYNLGDLDGDGLHTAQDFIAFASAYDAALGSGSFAQALAAVPEPASGALIGCGSALALCVNRRRFARRPRFMALLATLCATLVLGLFSSRAQAQLTLLREDFEELALGPNQEETLVGTNVWTNTPPTGWTTDNSGMPGYGNPMTDGVKEWAGWSFANKDWWVAAAGNQDRGLFTRGQGTVMVADPDEWDDLDGPARTQISQPQTPDDLYDSFIKTKTINIPAGIPAGRIKLSFDSSWRDEGMDDLDQDNNQTATVKVKYNNVANPIEVLNWDSDPEGTHFHNDAPNERVASLDLQYNGTATTLQLEFGLSKAWNDWWWAVDNISVEVPAAPSVLRIDTNTGRGFLVGGDVISTTIKSIDIASNGGKLSGATATGLSGASGMEKADGSDAGTTAGDSPGEQWEKLSSTNNRIFEAFLFGSSTFLNTRTVDLGVIFDKTTPVAQRDVTFSYTTATADSITGVVQYFTAPGVTGDYNNNGKVDAADYTVWRDKLGSNSTLPNDSTPGSVTQADYNVWKTNYGQSIGGGGALDVAAVPEPATFTLVALVLGLLSIRSRAGRFRAAGMLAALLMALSTAGAQAMTLDRDYRMGNNDPGAANNGNVASTFDSAGQLGMHQLTDLAAYGNLFVPPKYISVNDRPDGVSGLGINLNPLHLEEQFLRTGFEEALNYPERSPASIYSPGGTIDYTLISDRGFQLWVKPTFVTPSHIVMDTNQHGVFVNSQNKFAMRYAGLDYPSNVAVTANTWFHLSVVRSFGPGSGSVLYVNGVAVAAATGSYKIERVVNDSEGEPANLADLDTSPLVVGANTGALPGQNNFFSGVVDDLEMFVMGINHTRDFGEFVFQNDNDYAAHFKPTNPVDLTGDGAITLADAQMFAANWAFAEQLNWTDTLGDKHSLVVGDLLSRSKGDFNFDGRVDLADWGMLNSASPGVGAIAMRLIQGGTVPEPGTLVLVAIASTAFAARRRRSVV